MTTTELEYSTPTNTGLDRRVAVYGLGSMGGAMASALVQAGWSVTGFDPSELARAAADNAGVTTSASPADLAGIPYVVLSLPSAKVVEATVPGIFARPGTIAIVDTTTSEPQTSRAMAEFASEHGAAFVDAPVSGGNTGAASGTLAAFVGGFPGAIDAALPLLQALTGGKWKHVGPAGSGNVVKLLNNVLVATNLLAVAEAMDVVAAYGMDLGTALAAINSATGASIVSQKMFPEKILSGSFDSGFALGLMARDVALACDVARQNGSTPKVFAQTDEAWSKALADLGPHADFVSATSTFTSATNALHPTQIQSASVKESVAS